jgi:hypothetical protein
MDEKAAQAIDMDELAGGLEACLQSPECSDGSAGTGGGGTGGGGGGGGGGSVGP